MTNTFATTKQKILLCTKKISIKSNIPYLRVKTIDTCSNENDFLDFRPEHEELYTPGTSVELTLFISTSPRFFNIEIVEVKVIEPPGELPGQMKLPGC